MDNLELERMRKLRKLTIETLHLLELLIQSKQSILELKKSLHESHEQDLTECAGLLGKREYHLGQLDIINDLLNDERPENTAVH